MTAPGHAGSYRGFYINLERSERRRRNFDEQLRRLSLSDRYARFPAVDGQATPMAKSVLTPGENGCYLSHMRALEQGREYACPLHILEDDALLTAHVRPLADEAITANLFDRFDILFTDMMVNCHLGMLKTLKVEFAKLELPPSRPLRLSDLHVMDLAQQNFSCLTSYMVGARSIDRVLALYRQDIASGPTRPVDIFIRDCVLAGQLRAACLFPFVTSFRLDEVAGNTLGREQTVRPSVIVLAVLRHSYFVERDLAAAKAYLDSVMQDRRPIDAHHALIAQAVSFVLSDDFVEF